MKILLFCTEEDRGLAEGLLQEIRNDVEAGICAFKEGWNMGKPLPKADLSGLTHLGAVSSKPPAAAPWFTFAAGFALGARAALACYGPDIKRPQSFPKESWASFQDGKQFAAWVRGELKDWTARELPLRARTTLLEAGIPFSEASFQARIRGNDLPAAALFIEAGLSPDGRDSAGVPLLNLAVRAGSREITALLLKAGADINGRAGDRGASALLDAALGKYLGIMEDLLAAGADPNIKSKDGQSALIISVGLNNEAAVGLLLAAGADPDEADSLGTSARRYAALFNKPAMKALFDAHAPK